MKKTAIEIFINSQHNEVLNEILLGMEEEGIFHNITKCSEMNPEIQAEEAAKISKLGLGIGIYKDSVCLKCRNLPTDKWLFKYENCSPSCGRIIGSNAGRFVKGIPFK